MKNKDDLENYLVYGIHIQNRKIFFGSPMTSEDSDDDISPCSVALAIRAIDLMVSFNSKPIEIHMTSFGGMVYHMMALKDKMLQSPVKFIFYGYGRIASAATWIMACSDERYLSEDATVMVHNGGTYRDGESSLTKMTDQTIEAEEDERLQDRLNDIYADNSRMPKAFWDMLVQRDCFMTADEAIALGLADALIPYKKRGSFRKKREAALANHPSKRQMEAIVKKLLKRVKMDRFAKDITVQVPVEHSEVIPEYDNTEKELQKLAPVEDIPSNEKP